MKAVVRPILLITIFALCLASAPGWAAVHVVNAGESLQAAIDAAVPGDTILARPGVYAAQDGQASVLHVRTHDLTLIGSLAAVIDARGVDYGVLVGPDLEPGHHGCPSAPAVNGFQMRGFTVRNAGRTGARLVGVEDYRISHGVYLENAIHAASPVCSRRGRVDHNLASGHSGASVYASVVDGLRIDHNILKHSGLGIELENSVNAVAKDNWVTDNSAGVLVVARPGLPLPYTENISVENNWIAENNRPNPAGRVPVGSGILNVGGDDVLIRKNTVIGNDSFGIAVFGNPGAALDPRLEAFVDGLVVRRNIAKSNGNHPDRARLLTPAADLVFVPDVLDRSSGESVALDPDPTDNCFAENHFDTDLPSGIVARFACP